MYCKLIWYKHPFQDLAKMKIGNAHRNKIWKSLLDLRNQGFTAIPTDTQDLQKTASSTSTISIASQNSISQNSTYNPGYYEVTRYTFKHTISLTAEEKHLLEPSKKLSKMEESWKWKARRVLLLNATSLTCGNLVFSLIWCNFTQPRVKHSRYKNLTKTALFRSLKSHCCIIFNYFSWIATGFIYVYFVCCLFC